MREAQEASATAVKLWPGGAGGMTASAIDLAADIIEAAADLSADPITVAMFRIYRASSPLQQRAIERMLQRIAEDGVPIEMAGRLFFVEQGWPEAKARAAVSEVVNAPREDWRQKLD
jgi:hypothetical protein